ncbi:MAG: SDR family NAD(P)-dependent oxidoreductase [Nitrospira sp. CR1.3]|nr:SDR family NAD(P)-dependent oxidoreductase [Nitrospira sp. CR1.3]
MRKRASAEVKETRQPPRPVQSGVLVTGASGGIGRAISLAFAHVGWFVGVHYHQGKKSAEETLRQVCAVAGTGSLHQADLRVSEAVQQMVEAFVRTAPDVTALVCNAGVGGGGLVLRQQDDDWSNIIATNLTGTFHCLKAIGPILLGRGGGSIIVVGSHAAYFGSRGQSAYAASKAGLIGLVKTVAREWGAGNVRVNLLLPGWHRTALSEGAYPDDQEWRDHALRHPPSLNEVARTAVHLAQTQDVSGQVWNCDSRAL